MAAQYGLDTPESDVATVKRTLGRVSSPAILVGRSYGGSVITAAGTDDRVAGLVYIAALAPDTGETSQSQQEKFPVTDVFKYVELADGRLWMRREGVVYFAGDLSEQEQRLVWSMTGDTQTVTSRNDKEARAHVRLVAVYVVEGGRLRLAHFQSVSLS
jgi:pimeloyl-ACP methyl ester carboxylesterase